MNNLILNKAIIIFFSFTISFTGYSQQNEKAGNIDCKRDTLIVISHNTICKSKIYLNREDLLNADSLNINQTGFTIYSYKVSSFTLGNNLNLSISSGLITNNIKKAISSQEIQYKFLNFSNILLLDERNNIVKPTLYNFKIIFLD